MAGGTILRRALQVRQAACSVMAFGAIQSRMFANQTERHLVMVKARAMRVQPIVTGHAVRPEGQDMLRRKGLVDLQVAVGTGSLVERGYITLYMAILAGKGRAVRFGRVRFE